MYLSTIWSNKPTETDKKPKKTTLSKVFIFGLKPEALPLVLSPPTKQSVDITPQKSTKTVVHVFISPNTVSPK